MGSATGTLGDFTQLGQDVDSNSGVLTVTMERLRDEYGAGRLGIHVRTGISQALHSAGLDHYPITGGDGHPLEGDQLARVRVYRQGSPIAEVIDAVLHPSEGHDAELRELVGGDDAGQILKQVRELVCA
ncbi:MAG: hypothetical protein M0027_14090 [Candidatus Dormibacteraeota bacterium]|jgi:hypothetical protein|nr:hypothetical protein [Candidatus Dormibacteraeota bacterium]